MKGRPMEAENIRAVVVIGGGIMGQGIAQNFAQAGLSVSVVDVDQGKLDDCLAQVDANLRLFQEFGLLQEDIPSIKSRIHPVLSKDLDEAVKDGDFVVEAIPEVLALKKQLFAQLDSCREDIILSSNTSSFTISALAEGCRTAGRIIGVHYFNPAHIMPLVEIHYGPQTRDEVISTTKALMTRVGKKPILVRKEKPGFVVNRLQAALGREVMHLISEGVATPEDIDLAAKAMYGFRWACIGPVEGFDMIGLDTLLAVGEGLFPSLDNSDRQPQYLYDMVSRGELGIKSGKGFYDYTGRSRAEVLDELNRRLLPQLALFTRGQKKRGEGNGLWQVSG